LKRDQQHHVNFYPTNLQISPAANRNETLFFAALKTSEKQPGSVSYASPVKSPASLAGSASQKN
jgi:hypothetical protein